MTHGRKKKRVRLLVLAVAVTFIAWLASPRIAHPPALRRAATAEDLFAGTDVVRVQIEIDPSSIKLLKKTRFGTDEPRPAVKATVIEGGVVFTNVGVHLKGWYGSFRPVNQNPCFTLKFDKSVPGQTFHGLPKISLNNSVQDPSFLSEKICRELFEAAKVPVPRAAHAKVELNGRDLGLYVLTEGFTKDFFKRYFSHAGGNLYESHDNRDIDEPLIVNLGERREDDTQLQALASAMREPNPATRLERLEGVLDMDRFLSFLAMEVITCHWDGYAMNQNNFRIFDDIGSGKMVFIPSGMDQMFGTERLNPRCPVLPGFQGALARAVIETKEGRRRYLERISHLNRTVFREEQVLSRVDRLAAVIQPVIAESSHGAALWHIYQVNRLKSRITQRSESLQHQLLKSQQ